MDVCQPPSIAAKYLVFHLPEFRAGHDFPAIFTCRNSGDTKLIKGGYLGGVKDKLGECREGVTF